MNTKVTTYPSSGMTRPLIALAAISALALSLFTIVSPARAATSVPLQESHRGTSSANADKDDDCGDYATGSGVVWHFVLNNLDDNTPGGSVSASFQTAGTLTASAAKVLKNVQHFYVVTPTADKLLDATATVSDQSGTPKLLLSHVCNQTGGSTPTPTPTTPSTSTPTATPTSTPTAPSGPDVVVGKVASVTSIDVNGSYNYVITARNIGDAPANDVSTFDNLDNDLLVNSVTPSQGSCDPLAAGNQLTCHFGTLAAGASASVTINVTAGLDTCGLIDNRSTVSASNESADKTDNNKSEIVKVIVNCADEGDNVIISVIKYVCPANITSEAEFDALGSFLQKIRTCPVVTLPGDHGPAGALDAGDAGLVPNGEAEFNFTVTDENGKTYSMADGDAQFVPSELCEATAGDFDGNPNNNVCLETSSYMFTQIEDGVTSVTETQPPAGYGYGALEFTPDWWHANSDDASLVSAGNGVIVINTAHPQQSDVLLHVFNFASVVATPTPTPSETPSETATPTPEGSVQPGTGTPAPSSTPSQEQSVEAGTGTPAASMPNTAIAMDGGIGTELPTILFGLLLVASLGGLLVLNVKSAIERR